MKKKILFPLLIVTSLPFVLCAISNDDFFRLARTQRKVGCQMVKGAVASFDGRQAWPSQTNNGDEARYANLRGCFGKGLAHNASGFIETASFQSLVKALQAGSPSDFNAIPMGTGPRVLANPQASLAYSLNGIDGWQAAILPAPAFASAETAGEMAEVYWTALIRDVSFNQFDTDAQVAAAIADINQQSDFRGPKVNGQVTSETFLRGNTPGDLIGPYISQFLYLDIPYGPLTVVQEFDTPVPSTVNDFNTSFPDWLTVVNGGETGASTTLSGTNHFLRTPRDLAEYVHSDFPGQAGIDAALILNSFGPDALDPASPYVNNPTQGGFVTFGIADVLALVQKATEEALKAAWYHKWQVNRRCRPEEFAFYVQRQIVNGEPLAVNSELINSAALTEVFTTFGSYFLPQAYPEGSPTHPSYPAGHAAFAGAVATILKAFYNENFVLPSPVEPDGTNTSLVPYAGPDLTVGNELNKLASNIALGRDHAGVHYRSDGWQGILLGEQVAIQVLNNEAFLFNESFSGFTLTKFDGTTITVGRKQSL